MNDCTDRDVSRKLCREESVRHLLSESGFGGFS